MPKDSGWWDDFYPEFRPFFGAIKRSTTGQQVRYIVDKLDLKPGKSFLDCPCGIGRIGLPLMMRGVKVTGVDIMQSFLDEFESRATRRGLKPDLHRADMRRINFDSKFDAAGNLWTSFGYFEKESDNLLTMKKIYRALKPGGKFMLHIINRDWIMAKFREADWFEFKDRKVLVKRRFDFRTSINYETWQVIRKGIEKKYDVNVRNYSFHEIIDMMLGVGFVNIEGSGSTKDEPISKDRGMMFITGVKPKK